MNFSAVVPAELGKKDKTERIKRKMEKKREQKKTHTVAMGIMTIRGKEVEVMYDTCAANSAIEEEWVKHLKLQGIEDNSYPMVDAIGKILTFKKDVLVPLKFGDKVVNEVMMVAPKLTAPIIIGFDVLHKCDLLFTEGRLLYKKKHEVPIQMVDEGREDPRARLATLKRIDIPPATSIAIPCKVMGERKLHGRKMYIEPATELMVAHGLGKTMKQKDEDGSMGTILQVQITNPSFQHHTIPRGSIIAYASPMRTMAAITNYIENVKVDGRIRQIETVPLEIAMTALGVKDDGKMKRDIPIASSQLMAATVKDGELQSYQRNQEEQEMKKDDGARSFIPQKHIEEMVEALDISEGKKKRVLKMIEPFGGLFTLTVSREAANVPIPHRIITEGPPIHQKLYRRTPIMNDHIDAECQKLLEQHVIRESFSPWSSPVVLAWKKDGSIRFCVDYRKVNAVTKKDKYPLPRIDEAFDALAKAQFFSTIDLTSGYHQLPVAEDSKEITAFTTRKGHYEYNRVPMGMTNSPATFQRNMELILRGLTWQSCLVYVDDIIVFSSSFADHLQDVRTVLERLQSANLKIKPSKCSFFTRKVGYLGHVIEGGQIRPDSSNTKKINDMPLPTTKKEMQSFLGLAGYYRRFIHQFSDMARPLYELTQGKTHGGQPLELKEEHLKAIRELKERLCTYPVLRLPDFKQPFYVKPDASNYGIGAILMQRDPDGHEHPILYGSRTLSKPERNYSARERELLAMVYFVHHWRPYLLGTKFFVFTDHHSLQWLKNHKDDNPRLSRWIYKLMQYEFDVVHRPGSQHNDADAMSRTPIVRTPAPIASLLKSNVEYGCPEIPLNTEAGKNPEGDITAMHGGGVSGRAPVMAAMIDTGTGQWMKSEELAKWQLKDPTLRDIWNEVHEGKGEESKWKVVEECLYKVGNDRLMLVVPKNMREELVRAFHDGPIAGHPGQSRTLWAISQKFWWPKMYTEVMKYVRTCDTCNEKKPGRMKKTGKLHPIIATRPMEIMGIDILGPLTVTQDGNKYIVVLVDLFSKWIEAWAISDMETVTVARKMVEEFIPRNGVPETLTSDRGAQFISDLMREINNLMGTKQRFTTAYHPRANGQAENAVKKISAGLRLRVNVEQDDWDKHLWSTLLALRTQVTNTGHTPFFLWYVRDPNLPSVAQMTRWVKKHPKAEEYVKEVVKEQTEAYQKALEKIKKAKKQNERLYNKGRKKADLVEGDTVMLRNEAKLEKGKKKKLAVKWRGPYRIIEIRAPNNARIVGLNNPQDRQLVNFDRLKKRELRPGQFPQMEQDKKKKGEKMLYRIQSLVKVRGKPGKREFLVRWEGYTAKKDLWIPEEEIEATDLIEEFDRNRLWDTSKAPSRENAKAKKKQYQKKTKEQREEQPTKGSKKKKQWKKKEVENAKKKRKDVQEKEKEKEDRFYEEERNNERYQLRNKRKKTTKMLATTEAPRRSVDNRKQGAIPGTEGARSSEEEDVVRSAPLPSPIPSSSAIQGN